MEERESGAAGGVVQWDRLVEITDQVAAETERAQAELWAPLMEGF